MQTSILTQLSTTQLYLLISLTIFIFEASFFFWLKHTLQTHTLTDPIFEHLTQFLKKYKPSQALIYTGVYALLLYLAKLWPFIFIIIFIIQGLSVICNIGLYIKYKNTQNDT